jgi:hypothetical protein
MKPYMVGLLKKQLDIENKIRKYQDIVCQHVNVIKTPKSNTGNWDRSDDKYWNEYKCSDCNKFWIEDQKLCHI